MPRHKPIRIAIQTTVFVLAGLFVFQTWFVGGLFIPLRIDGPSMAPAFFGASASMECRDCGFVFRCFFPSDSSAWHPVCPNCGYGHRESPTMTERQGQRVLANRVSLNFWPPERWEPMILRDPRNPDSLIVKRIVGLPGETVALDRGDLFVDGRVAQKDLDRQKTMAILVHDAAFESKTEGILPRWRAESDSTAWKEGKKHWIHPPKNAEADKIDWLVYRHVRRLAGASNEVRPSPIDSLSCYSNFQPQRAEQIFPVRDLLVSCRLLPVEGKGAFYIRIQAGRGELCLQIIPATGKILLERDEEQQGDTADLPGSAESPHLLDKGREIERATTASASIPFGRSVDLDVSTIDRRFLLALNGRIVLEKDLQDFSETGPSVTPFALGVQDLAVEISGLKIYRDVYYVMPVEAKAGGENYSFEPLGKDEYFILGDNPLLSEDSRMTSRFGSVKKENLFARPIVISK